MKKFLSLWLPVLLWALVIFAFSSLPAIKTSQIYWVEFLFKKSSHLVEYMIFLILFYRAVKNSFSLSQNKALIISLLILFFYACSDEFHQIFSFGREPTVRDVIIDILGGLIAIWILKFWLPKAPKKLKNLAQNWQIL